jgi:hypothetical protein
VCVQFPITLVSLVDKERQWFKSKVGLGVEETHRDLAFCSHVIYKDGSECLVVSDTWQVLLPVPLPVCFAEAHRSHRFRSRA